MKSLTLNRIIQGVFKRMTTHARRNHLRAKRPHLVSSTVSPRAPATSCRRALRSEAAQLQTPKPAPVAEEGPHISSTSERGTWVWIEVWPFSASAS